MSAARFVLDGIPTGWNHVDNYLDRPRRDTSWDYVPAHSHNEERTIGYNIYYTDEDDVGPRPSRPQSGFVAGPSTSVRYIASTVSPAINAISNGNGSNIPSLFNSEYSVARRFL